MIGRDDDGSDDDLFSSYTTAEVEELANELSKEVEFEQSFYVAVAETDNFEIILVPDNEGRIPTSEERKYLEAVAKSQGTKILYRISHKTYATVFDPETLKIGVMPETNSKGFEC